MGFLPFFQWGLILQALAVVHFIRRRPDTFWLYGIIFLGGLGAFVYILVEVVPDLGLLRHVLDAQGRRKRIVSLKRSCSRTRRSATGRNSAISISTSEIRACTRVLRQGHFTADHSRRPDLSPRYRRDSPRRLPGRRRQSGNRDRARRALRFSPAGGVAGACVRGCGQCGKGRRPVSTGHRVVDPVRDLHELRVLLASQGRHNEAREWAQRVLARKPAMPRYLQRRERPWFRKASALLKRVPKLG